MKLDILVSEINNQNETVMSDTKNKNIMKAKRNVEYLMMLDKSMAEAEAGKFIVKSIDELRELE